LLISIARCSIVCWSVATAAQKKQDQQIPYKRLRRSQPTQEGTVPCKTRRNVFLHLKLPQHQSPRIASQSRPDHAGLAADANRPVRPSCGPPETLACAVRSRYRGIDTYCTPEPLVAVMQRTPFSSGLLTANAAGQSSKLAACETTHSDASIAVKHLELIQKCMALWRLLQRNRLCSVHPSKFQRVFKRCPPPTPGGTVPRKLRWKTLLILELRRNQSAQSARLDGQ
jgi:hypothetical protein